MAIVTLADLRQHLGLTAGVAEEDDPMLENFLAGAQALVEAELGYGVAARYPDEVPPALGVAVLQMAALWYEQRLPVAPENLNAIPWAARAIIDAFRDRSF